MAASGIRKSFLTLKGVSTGLRHIHVVRRSRKVLSTTLFIGTSCTSFVAWQIWKRYTNKSWIPQVNAAQGQDASEKTDITAPKTNREERFQQFASIQVDGVPYMTPQDFLESVTEDTPRHLKNGSSARIGRTSLSQHDVESWLKSTPTKRRGSINLFRSMHNRGLISYTEYLFLLCVLTKPQSGFRIAFNMFDTDGNQIVDKKEFLVLEGVFSKRQDAKTEPSNKMEDKQDHSVSPIQETTLLVHFFGRKGNDVLKYEDFFKFMTNLQSEVIELEFLEFSRGMRTISEEDFARILLRYTNLDKEEIGQCMERVKNKMPVEKGITFEEFREFCQFMNSLDDFTIAMNMYTYAQLPISKEEFQRAVKICTGSELGAHIVHTLFNMFDVDGDGNLSYKEFISIMKDRKHRGFRHQTQYTPRSWDAFKACVKNEMKSY